MACCIFMLNIHSIIWIRPYSLSAITLAASYAPNINDRPTFFGQLCVDIRTKIHSVHIWTIYIFPLIRPLMKKSIPFHFLGWCWNYDVGCKSTVYILYQTMNCQVSSSVDTAAGFVVIPNRHTDDSNTSVSPLANWKYCFIKMHGKAYLSFPVRRAKAYFVCILAENSEYFLVEIANGDFISRICLSFLLNVAAVTVIRRMNAHPVFST